MKKSFIYILFFLTAFGAKAQETSVNGTVTNEKGAPVAGATVFIANSKKITTTNESGEFSFGQMLPGTYEIVVKTLSFDPYSQIIIVQAKQANFVIRLKESTIALETVVIKSKGGNDQDRARYLQLFIKNFIGESPNAAHCEILNPEVLNLYYDKGNNVLEANSQGFLTIENHNLGYKVNYLVNQFKLDMKNRTLFYQGSIYFEELKGSASVQKRWDEAREIAYKGSTRHFYKAAFNHTAKAEGFLVYSLPAKQILNKLTKNELLKFTPVNTDSLFTTINPDFRLLNLKSPNELYIIYTREKEPSDFARSGRSIELPFKFPSRIKQISAVRRITEDSIVTDRNGNFSFKTVLASGYWSWEAMADMLPLDYVSHSTDQPNLPRSGSIRELAAAVDTFRNRYPVEKPYLHFDKPYYTSGDTMRFKAYLFDAAYLSAAEKSGILYLELANDTGKVIVRRMLRLSSGLGQGNIALNKDDIPQGRYTLRAYTNQMRNFGEDYIFKKNFYVSSIAADSWLVGLAVRQSVFGGKDSIRMGLQFRLINGNPVGLKELQLRLMDGRKTLFRNKFQTAADGKLEVNFILPEKTDAKDITILAEDPARGQENRRVAIPVTVNRPANTDLQFMPEGGNLVAGITSKVGFKAISEDGKGAEISGKIYTSSGTEIVSFTSMHKGMGSFEINPVSGQHYSAKIIMPDGTTKSYPLPVPKSSGTVLRINNVRENDSVEVQISVSASLMGTSYYLIGQSRGVVCYAARITLNIAEVSIKVPENAFPTGIARFSLLTLDRQPVNERITFIDHHDNLKVTVNPDRTSYTPRDSIALSIQVKNEDGKPVQGSFSLAVTDDSQVKTDSIAGNILTNLLLTSDLKGTVEDPGYYLQSTNEALRDFDNLLLTQGWVGYEWKDVFDQPKTPAYKTEPEFMVNGKVNNILNNPVAGTSILLFSNRPVIVRDTVTDRNGLFSFKSFPPIDTAKFVIQARNKKEKSFNIGITIDKFKPPVFKRSEEHFLPWYLNTDTTLLHNINTRAEQQKAFEKIPEGENVLKEVEIIAKKVIADSYNLNGPGEADQILDEKELQEAGKMTLFQLLEKRIKGFNLRNSPHLPGPLPADRFSYRINEKEIHVIIDGMDIEEDSTVLDPTSLVERKDFIKSILEQYTAEDIKGIEVMYNMRYVSRYLAEFAGAENIDYPYAWLEITTYSGKGPLMKNTTGVYYYKSIPFVSAKTFYRPKYPAKDNPSATLTDLRSTIHWAPNIITDKEGRALVSFYSADRPGTYTIILEGSDMNGNIGYQQKKIKISSK